MLRVGILTIGDEICIGQIVNTNAAWIAQQCSQIGANVTVHSTIGDEKDAMIRELQRLTCLVDVLLLTGGLGPTHDDITKSILCDFLNDTLVEDTAVIQHLEQYFIHRGRTLTDRNRGQALVPQKATLLTNTRGTAPGLLFEPSVESNQTLLVSMPGVPNEMKGIMTEYVLPKLQNILEVNKLDVMVYHTLHTAGIPESTLADMLGDVSAFIEGQSLAFLPSYTGVRLRISVQAKSYELAQLQINRIKTYIESRIHKYIVGENDDTLSITLHKEFLKQKKTLALAESCTSGLLGSLITENPGSSEYFLGGVECYANDVKISLLNVNQSTITDYGAVSKQSAEELAIGVRTLLKSDIGLSITGIAGPDGGSEEKPVGTVWIGISDSMGTTAQRFQFGNERRANKERSCSAAMSMLLTALRTHSQL